MKRKTAIIHGRIVTRNEILQNKSIIIEDRNILDITDESDFSNEYIEIIDANGYFIIPGLVDLHSHGCLHHTFNELDEKAHELILQENLKHGITSMVPTLMAAPIPDLCDAIRIIGEKKKEIHTSFRTKVLGAYLESPYISPEQCGAIPKIFILSPSDGTIHELLRYADDIKVLMVAPEREGAFDIIRNASDKGIIVSLGHSMADYDDVIRAIDFGASHVTHLWSAMSSVHRNGPWRIPGLLETALTDDRVTAEIIADNRHLPPTLMRLACKCKGNENLIAVSDALNGAGLPEGEHFYSCGMEYEVHDGVGMVLDHSCFAGSTTLLDGEIPVLIEEVGLSIPQAIRMVTEIPARIVNEKCIGKLEKGCIADIVILDNEYKVNKVFSEGTLAYSI